MSAMTTLFTINHSQKLIDNMSDFIGVPKSWQKIEKDGPNLAMQDAAKKFY